MDTRPQPRTSHRMSHHMSLALFAALALFLGGCGLFGGDEEEGGEALQAELTSLNEADAEGSVTIDIDEEAGEVTVAVATTGMSPGLPHAQHLHIGGEGTCPEVGDTGDDEVIDTAEAQPSYGEIRISLTTEGDMAPASGLAIDRMPTATDDGAVTYSRTFPLPEDLTTDDLGDAVFVQHGISELLDDPAQYDGVFDSPLTPDVPLEATLPALCGALDAG